LDDSITVDANPGALNPEPRLFIELLQFTNLIDEEQALTLQNQHEQQPDVAMQELALKAGYISESTARFMHIAEWLVSTGLASKESVASALRKRERSPETGDKT